MAAATTRLWIPNLWLPRTEFRLRRSRSIEDDRALVRLDSAVAAESHVLNTGSGPALPIGGDESLRGVKPYTLLTPTTTVAAPFGLAQIHSARDSAGVNGVVRFPAGATFAGGATMSVAGQTWQGANAATSIINGGLNVTATGCTLEGFQVNNDIALPSSGNGHNFTMRNVKRQGGGGGFRNSGRDGMRVLNCEFYGTTSHFTGMVGSFFFNNTDGHIDGALIENCIALKTTGPSQSVISGLDHDVGAVENGTMKNFKVRNCRFDGGLYTADSGNSPNGGGWFGVEVWHNLIGSTLRSDGLFAGGIVEYCDLRGGNVLISMVRSLNNWIHHNRFDITVGFAAYESAGSGGNPARGDHHDALIEFNVGFAGESSSGKELVTHNTLAARTVIRNNDISNIRRVVDHCGNGYQVKDNCVSNVPHMIENNTGCTGVVISNNTANACGF